MHEIVSSDPNDTNYFNADPSNSKSLDRSNIYIEIQNVNDEKSLACLDDRLQIQYVVYKVRCDLYGTARYPKTIIMVDDPNLATLLDLIKEVTFEELMHGVAKHGTLVSRYPQNQSGCRPPKDY